MDYQSRASLTSLFFEQAERLGPQPFLWAKRGGSYRPLTWRETRDQVLALAAGLAGLGVGPGDRVLLVSENRPEWLVADFAIMSLGAITVPAYVTNTTGDHRHVLQDSGAIGALVSSRALAARLLPAAREAADCRFLVGIEDPGESSSAALELHRWESLVAQGTGKQPAIPEAVARARRDDLACFIYTSGTGGRPKGVMLSHGNILCNCMSAHHLLVELGLEDEVFLSFLPLSHSYEHTTGHFFPMSIAAQIYYAEGADQLLTNLAEARPTIMTAVPRLYESMHQRIRHGIAKQGGLKLRLFETAERLGRKRYLSPGTLGPLEQLQDAVVERLVREKMRQRFGGRLKAMVSGGGALNTDIGVFFTALGLRILQGYGQTEASPVISCNPPFKVKMHTVGPPLRGVEARIAEDGEILVRGELVMKGYWGDEEGTAIAIRDGWLHTGDIGSIDGDGFIQITDRKKDILVLSGGDNVSPAKLEGTLTLQREIHQAMVHGDRRPHLVALLVPDEEWLRDWAGLHGKPADLASLHDDKALAESLGAVVARVNRELSQIERIRRFVVARDAFTVDNDMMTPTLKIRRHVIRERYGAQLDGLYGSA